MANKFFCIILVIFFSIPLSLVVGNEFQCSVEYSSEDVARSIWKICSKIDKDTISDCSLTVLNIQSVNFPNWDKDSVERILFSLSGQELSLMQDGGIKKYIPYLGEKRIKRIINDFSESANIREDIIGELEKPHCSKFDYEEGTTLIKTINGLIQETQCDNDCLEEIDGTASCKIHSSITSELIQEIDDNDLSKLSEVRNRKDIRTIDALIELIDFDEVNLFFKLFIDDRIEFSKRLVNFLFDFDKDIFFDYLIQDIMIRERINPRSTALATSEINRAVNIMNNFDYDIVNKLDTDKIDNAVGYLLNLLDVEFAKEGSSRAILNFLNYIDSDKSVFVNNILVISSYLKAEDIRDTLFSILFKTIDSVKNPSEENNEIIFQTTDDLINLIGKGSDSNVVYVFNKLSNKKGMISIENPLYRSIVPLLSINNENLLKNEVHKVISKVSIRTDADFENSLFEDIIDELVIDLDDSSKKHKSVIGLAAIFDAFGRRKDVNSNSLIYLKLQNTILKFKNNLNENNEESQNDMLKILSEFKLYPSITITNQIGREIEPSLELLLNSKYEEVPIDTLGLFDKITNKLNKNYLETLSTRWVNEILHTEVEEYSYSQSRLGEIKIEALSALRPYINEERIGGLLFSIKYLTYAPYATNLFPSLANLNFNPDGINSKRDLAISLAETFNNAEEFNAKNIGFINEIHEIESRADSSDYLRNTIISNLNFDTIYNMMVFDVKNFGRTLYPSSYQKMFNTFNVKDLHNEISRVDNSLVDVDYFIINLAKRDKFSSILESNGDPSFFINRLNLIFKETPDNTIWFVPIIVDVFNLRKYERYRVTVEDALIEGYNTHKDSKYSSSIFVYLIKMNYGSFSENNKRIVDDLRILDGSPEIIVSEVPTSFMDDGIFTANLYFTSSEDPNEINWFYRTANFFDNFNGGNEFNPLLKQEDKIILKRNNPPTIINLKLLRVDPFAPVPETYAEDKSVNILEEDIKEMVEAFNDPSVDFISNRGHCYDLSRCFCPIIEEFDYEKILLLGSCESFTSAPDLQMRFPKAYIFADSGTGQGNVNNYLTLCVINRIQAGFDSWDAIEQDCFDKNPVLVGKDLIFPDHYVFSYYRFYQEYI